MESEPHPIFDVLSPNDRPPGTTYEMVANLVRQDPSCVNERDNYRGTPLWWAAAQNDLAIVRFLLEQGADVNAADEEGLTPLHCLRAYSPAYGGSEDHVEIVRLLLERGADVNVGGWCRWTPLFCAVADYNRSPKALRLLLKAGADVTWRTESSWKPLHTAAAAHFTTGVRQLLSAGADVNAQDKEGNTPLKLVEDRVYIGADDYYPPVGRGGGRLKEFAGRRKRITALLRAAGGHL
jgi:ankyrin repeat protein